MGKFKSCAIILKEKRNTYRGGELVSGMTVLEVLEPVTVKSVRVHCFGQALTKWSKDFSRDWNSDQVGFEKYFNMVMTVYGNKVNESGPVFTLTAGQHKFSFAFRLPQEVPSSFEGQHGAIRWHLKVEVEKPFPSINNKWHRAFTVLSKLDLNEPVYQRPQSKALTKTVSKALGLGNAGTISLSATTDHFGYCPGENITLQVTAKNESTKDMGKVIVSLVQRVVFTANDETKVTNTVVAGMQTEMTVAKETTMALKDLKLAVPAVPPCTKKLTCHIISCTYFVEVKLQVPWGFNLENKIPVAIGTVPRGKSIPPPRQPNAPVVPQPPRMTIEYRKCTAGIIPCTKNHNSFPNFPYTPETAFADSDSTPLPPAAATGAAAAAAGARAAAPATGAATLPYEVGQEAGEEGATNSYKAAEAAAAAPPPPYPEPSAPPAYEDVLKMDEEILQRTTTQASTSSSSSQNNGAAAGKDVAVMLVRFPDTMLASFRECIRSEQNNLLDDGEAFLAALSPQPISGLDSTNVAWPQRTVLALLVFPDLLSGEGWLSGVSERGEDWYPACDAIIMPATWNVSLDSTGPLLFSLAVMKLKEGATKKELQSLVTTYMPPVQRLRQEMEVVKIASTKEIKPLHGAWVTEGQSISLSHWPKVDNYFACREALKKGELAKCQEALRSLFGHQTVVIISEDIRPLSSQPCLDMDDSLDDEDVKESGDENCSENLLISEEHFSA